MILGVILALLIVLSFSIGFKLGYDRKSRVDRLVEIGREALVRAAKEILPSPGRLVEWMPPTSPEEEVSKKVIEGLEHDKKQRRKGPN